MRSISSGVACVQARRAARRDRCRGRRRIEAADHRLEGIDGPAGVAQMPDQRGGDKGLADIGAGAGDEDGGHRSALQDAVAHEAARRSISASGWPAVNVKRSRAVPAGTVGGRIAITRKPSASRSRDASSAASASPMTSGTIALVASGRPSRRVKCAPWRAAAPHRRDRARSGRAPRSRRRPSRAAGRSNRRTCARGCG